MSVYVHKIILWKYCLKFDAFYNKEENPKRNVGTVDVDFVNHYHKN